MHNGKVGLLDKNQT